MMLQDEPMLTKIGMSSWDAVVPKSKKKWKKWRRKGKLDISVSLMLTFVGDCEHGEEGMSLVPVTLPGWDGNFSDVLVAAQDGLMSLDCTSHADLR